MNPPGIFVVGTDTGVGKTHVASLLIRSLRGRGRKVGALKLVATGAKRNTQGELTADDTETLLAALGEPREPLRVTPILFETPLAPCVAARVEGTRLAASELQTALAEALAWWSGRAEVMVVEGVGGLLCPLAEGTTVADLALALDYPLLIVGRRGLGTLNHCLLTIEATRARDLRIAGIVLNEAQPTVEGLAEATNAEELARRCPEIPVLAELPFDENRTLPKFFDNVDWLKRALPSRQGGSRLGW